MNREFLDLYNRELKLLKEQAREFAEEYPGDRGAARRNAGRPHRSHDRRTPRRRGLSSRTSAAQAQARISGIHQQSPRTTCSALSCADSVGSLAKVLPTFGDEGVSRGRAIRRGSYIDAAYRQLDRQVACRYRLCSDIRFGPSNSSARSISRLLPVQALGLSVGEKSWPGCGSH